MNRDNAIAHWVWVFMKDFTRYADMKFKAISQMKDFNIFGTGWQDEILKKRMEMISHA